MKYCVKSGNNFSIVELRETKTQLILDLFRDEETNELVCERFKKVANREYIAQLNEFCDHKEVYELTCDIAIKNLGENILKVDHPMIDHIKDRYEFLRNVKESKSKLQDFLNKSWSREDIEKVNKFLDNL